MIVTGAEIIPELTLADPVAGRALLETVFGFVPDQGGLLRLGNQRLALVKGQPQGHGPLHHLALGVGDARTALEAARARGGRIEAAETPDGPVLIPEFWDHGAEYVFIEGPEGARIELCARPNMARDGLPGHDHIGIACRDLPAMRAFFLNLGLTELAATTLHRPSGNVGVSFLSTGLSTVELYAPPVPPDPSPAPFWRLLRVTGLAETLQGPDGLLLVPGL